MSNNTLGELFRKSDEQKSNSRQLPELLKKNYVLTNGSGSSYHTRHDRIPALFPIQQYNVVKPVSNYFNGASSSGVADYHAQSHHLPSMNGRYVPIAGSVGYTLADTKHVQRGVPSLAHAQPFPSSSRNAYLRASLEGHSSKVRWWFAA